MCIAILKPKDKTIPKETLKRCSEVNKDGCGFAYCDNGILHINKYMNFEAFYKDYSKVENKSNMLIHFRIATHGKVELKNCHPFKLNNRMALIHNGVISGYGDKENKTDTQDFIDKILSKISWKEFKNPAYRQLVGNAIGYSKFCVLDITGDYYIINEDKGEWVDGVWYSNNSYKPKPATIYKSYSNYPNQQKIWDMYGDESYEAWCDKIYRDDEELEIIYKCNNCGKQFNAKDYVKYPSCKKCKSLDVKEIGYVDKVDNKKIERFYEVI